jgi:hypothetical protein
MDISALVRSSDILLHWCVTISSRVHINDQFTPLTGLLIMELFQNNFIPAAKPPRAPFMAHV